METGAKGLSMEICAPGLSKESCNQGLFTESCSQGLSIESCAQGLSGESCTQVLSMETCSQCFAIESCELLLKGWSRESSVWDLSRSNENENAAIRNKSYHQDKHDKLTRRVLKIPTHSTVQPVPTRHRRHTCIKMRTALPANTRT